MTTNQHDLLDEARRQRAWQALREAADKAADTIILELLRGEADRLERFTVDAAGLWIDLSRNRLPRAGLERLLELAQLSGVTRMRDAMFAGEPVNFTEQRPAWHTALRAPQRAARTPGAAAAPDDADAVASSGSGTPALSAHAVADDVAQTLARMAEFSDAVRDGRWRGASGRAISDIVHIGIGGSHLGPQLACDALAAYAHPRLRCHFLSNVDPAAGRRITDGLNPHTTLVIVASKSWRTLETARNAEAIRRWMLDGGIASEELHRHFIGVTANVAGAREFGLAQSSIFPFRDWVGGRFSLWSAIGLPVMLSIGAQRFREMLDGAHAMDRHFVAAPPARNAPLLLALVSLWNSLAIGSGTEAVVPYSDALRRLAAYLQQLQMESNGKRVDRDGKPLAMPSSPVIWGEPGTDAQHSFFQLLHQGTQTHPVDFVVALGGERDPEGRGDALLANALAQSEALLMGRDGYDGMEAADTGTGTGAGTGAGVGAGTGVGAGGAAAQRAWLAAHRACPGNRPSNLIVLDALDPRCFGALLALYEHKTAVLGCLWRIDSFDQWGVELGKQLAAEIEPLLRPEATLPDSLSPPLRALLTRIRASRGQ